LAYLAEQLLWLRSLECPALFVFDGPAATAAKQPERARRAEAKSANEQRKELWEARLQERAEWDDVLVGRAKVEQYARASVSVGEPEREQLKSLLVALGFSWREAPGEAEQYLALLQARGDIEEVVTEDSDALVCGARSIIRGFWSLRVGDGAQRVSTAPLLQGLAVDATDLRTAAVLAGCDFAPKIRNVGLTRALKAARLAPVTAIQATL
jgi:5'-3' exonuclease